MKTKDGVVKSNLGISATAATIKMLTLQINQSINQTISVVANGNTYTETVKLPYGTQWTATVTPDTYYTAGTLSVKPLENN